MSKNGKPGAKHPGTQSTDTRSRRELLDELSSIQSLLGDAAADVAPHTLGEEDDIPTLPPAAEDDEIGDAHAQIPLLGEKPTPQPITTTKPERAASESAASQAPAERVNPFLPKTNTPTKPAREKASQDIEKLIAQRTQDAVSATSAASTASAQALSGHQIRVLAEEVLAEWMPKIERDLRNRLIDALKNNH
jgi:hypothetical protein